MTKTIDAQRMGMVRKGLARFEAAAFVGVSTTIFDRMVREGVMPRPKVYGGCKIYDRDRLALALEALPDDGEDVSSEWDDVLE